MLHFTPLYALYITCLLISGCTDSSDEGGEILVVPNQSNENQSSMDEMDMGQSDVSPEGVELSIRAIDPLTNQGVIGLSATLAQDILGSSNDNTRTTDSNGKVTFNLSAESNYEVILEGTGFVAHHLFGELGSQSTEQISFVSNQSLTQQVYSALGMTPAQDKGIVVIGLDLPNLSPAVGTSVDLNAEYEKAFVLGSFGPSEGNEVITGGSGFVSFANVVPGQVEVLIQANEGENCAVFPLNETTSLILPVYAGEVSIVAFTCQTNW